MGARYNGSKKNNDAIAAAATSPDKLSETTRELLMNGAILVKNTGDGDSRLYVLPEHADALQRALTRDCFAGASETVGMESVWLTNPDTFDTTKFQRLEIPSQQAEMIANGVKRTKNGERNGITNTLILESKGAPEDDIDLHPKAFKQLANVESLVSLVSAQAREARPSGFGGITGK